MLPQRRLAELLIDQRRFDEVPAAIDLARDLGATPIDLAVLNAQLAAQTGQFEIAGCAVANRCVSKACCLPTRCQCVFAG
ncbi:MAG: hypothetical protein U0559_02455 [Anaerolineae bacterium]